MNDMNSEDKALAAHLKAQHRRRTMANCTPVQISIDGVEMEAYVDADMNLEMLLVGGVDLGPALDTISGCRREWREYLDAVIAAELAVMDAENAEAA